MTRENPAPICPRSDLSQTSSWRLDHSIEELDHSIEELDHSIEELDHSIEELAVAYQPPSLGVVLRRGGVRGPPPGIFSFKVAEPPKI